MDFWLLVICSYVLGSIPFSYWIPLKFAGVDVRKEGSGNVGASNVVYATSMKLGLLCFLLDLGKGFAVGLVTLLLFWSHPLFFLPAFAVVLGHDFSLFLRGKAGKGVATSLGVLLGFQPLLGLLMIGCAVLLGVSTKYMSVATLGGFTITSMASLLFFPLRFFWLVGGLTALMLFTHRDNFVRLVQGKEFKITDRAEKPQNSRAGVRRTQN